MLHYQIYIFFLPNKCCCYLSWHLHYYLKIWIRISNFFVDHLNISDIALYFFTNHFKVVVFSTKNRTIADQWFIDRREKYVERLRSAGDIFQTHAHTHARTHTHTHTEMHTPTLTSAHKHTTPCCLTAPHTHTHTNTHTYMHTHTLNTCYTERVRETCVNCSRPLEMHVSSLPCQIGGHPAVHRLC